jgi:hypothetical protein
VHLVQCRQLKARLVGHQIGMMRQNPRLELLTDPHLVSLLPLSKELHKVN